MRWTEEHALTAKGLDGVALRYSLLDGPGPASEALIDGLRKREPPVLRNSGCCRESASTPPPRPPLTRWLGTRARPRWLAYFGLADWAIKVNRGDGADRSQPDLARFGMEKAPGRLA